MPCTCTPRPVCRYCGQQHAALPYYARELCARLSARVRELEAALEIARGQEHNGWWVWGNPHTGEVLHLCPRCKWRLETLCVVA